jgi:hypothetical protein
MKRGNVITTEIDKRKFLFALLISAVGLLALPDSSRADSVLDSVRVVPNPYNVSGRTHGPRSNASAYERIMFTNLPVPNEQTPTRIRIYSMTLDLVAVLEHDSQDNLYFWDGRNSDNQYVVSGVYYYVIEHPDYGTKMDKLVIIR